MRHFLLLRIIVKCLLLLHTVCFRICPKYTKKTRQIDKRNNNNKQPYQYMLEDATDLNILCENLNKRNKYYLNICKIPFVRFYYSERIDKGL